MLTNKAFVTCCAKCAFIIYQIVMQTKYKLHSSITRNNIKRKFTDEIQILIKSVAARRDRPLLSNKGNVNK